MLDSTVSQPAWWRSGQFPEPGLSHTHIALTHRLLLLLLHHTHLHTHTHAHTLSPTHTTHHTEAIGTGSPKQVVKDIKEKAKSVVKGSSALPNSLATLADLNADVRGAAESYRDPAIAVPQDKAQGKLEGACVWGWCVRAQNKQGKPSARQACVITACIVCQCCVLRDIAVRPPCALLHTTNRTLCLAFAPTLPPPTYKQVCCPLPPPLTCLVPLRAPRTRLRVSRMLPLALPLTPRAP